MNTKEEHLCLIIPDLNGGISVLSANIDFQMGDLKRFACENRFLKMGRCSPSQTFNRMSVICKNMF